MRYRTLLIVPLAILAFVATLIIVSLSILASEAGSRWLIEFSKDAIPGELTIGRIEGGLLTTWTAHRINYRNKENKVRIQKLHFDWDPMALLRRATLDVRAIHVEDVAYSAPEVDEQPAQTSFTLPPRIDLPISIAINEAQLDRLVIRRGEDQQTIDSLSFSARADSERLEVKRLKIRAFGIDARLRGRAGMAASYPFTANLDWNGELQGISAQGEAAIEGDITSVQIRHKLTGPATVDTHGTVVLSNETPEFDFKGSWKKLQFPFQGTPMYHSKQGNFHLLGRLESYQLTLDGQLDGKEIPAMRIYANGLGGPDNVRFETLDARTLGGRVTTKGQIAWQPELRWDLTVDATRINPGLQWPEWPGELALNAKTQGRIRAGTPQIAAQIARLNGSLRKQPVDAAGEIALDDKHLVANDLKIRSGGNRLVLNGNLGPTLDLKFRLDAPNLAQVWPRLKGRLSGNGHLTGSRTSPTATVHLEGGQVVFGDYSVASLLVNANVDSNNERPSNATIRLDDLRVGDIKASTVEVIGNGRVADHRIQAHVTAATGRADIQLGGRYKDQTWKAALTTADLTAKEFGLWRLTHQANIELSTKHARLSRACWTQDAAQACAQGSWGDRKGWAGEARIDRYPIERIAHLLPDQMEGSGSVDAELVASDPGPGVTADLKIRSEDGTFSFLSPDRGLLKSHYKTMTLSAKYARDIADGDLSLDLDRSHVVGHFQVANVSRGRPNRPIDGSIHVKIPDLAFANAFLPNFEGVQGSATVDALVAGTLDSPRVRGEAKLSQGTARLPELGLQLEDIDLTAKSEGEDLIVFHGGAKSGEGNVDITGEAKLNAQAGWPFELQIQGEEFEVAQLSQIQAIASPDLAISGKHQQIEVFGDILIPEAKIRVKELPANAITVSPDQVILSDSDEPEADSEDQPLAIHADVGVTLGDKVKLSGFGLKTGLTGQLKLRSIPGRSPTALGSVTLENGKFKKYGQNLTIERGRLLFEGPVDDPSLDVRAVRRSGDVTAGIALTGTLTDPETELFSRPAMSDANILAYLASGKPLSSATYSDDAAINNLALGLGLKAVMPSELGSRLGLDEFGVESKGSFDKTSLLVGKYLTPSLYISYTQGLFQKLGAFELKYQLTDHISLDAHSGEQQAIDVTYSINR